MRARWLLALALFAAGCGPKPPNGENQVNAGQNSAAANTSAASANAAANEANGAMSVKNKGILPPANASVRYLGKWATSPANCASDPWTFTRDALSTKDGPKCSFYNVAKVPGGYDVAAQCPTKQPIHTDLIKLRFAESAGAMLVESNAIAPTGLIYCGK